MANAIVIKNLRKTYASGTEALKGVSLTVEEGGFFALLGPNGAGKSTMINILAGLTDKTSGTVQVFDADIDTDRDRAKSYIGVVPQEMNFNIFEKVFDIVCVQAGYYGIPRAIAAKRAEKYLKALGLWEKRNEKAQTLSGGMKRRLMIARGLVHEPRLLILDEPTAGVDVELRRGMWDFLKTLTDEEGVTIILTTHYLEEAEQLAKRVAIINKGDIIKNGAVKSLLSDVDAETFLVDLSRAAGDDALVALAEYAPVMSSDDTLEVTVHKQALLSDAILLLKEQGVDVRSIRPKGNRLEELFVRLTTEV